MKWRGSQGTMTTVIYRIAKQQAEVSHCTVEPERLPRLARDQVAHPRVRNLVRDHAGQRTVAGEQRRRHKGQLRKGDEEEERNRENERKREINGDRERGSPRARRFHVREVHAGVARNTYVPHNSGKHKSPFRPELSFDFVCEFDMETNDWLRYQVFGY